MMIQDFLSFGYCDALKDGLSCTVKVFMNGARASLLLFTGVPSMQTWPIIRNERRLQLLHCFLSTASLYGLHILQSHNNNSKGQPCSKTNKAVVTRATFGLFVARHCDWLRRPTVTRHPNRCHGGEDVGASGTCPNVC